MAAVQEPTFAEWHHDHQRVIHGTVGVGDMFLFYYYYYYFLLELFPYMIIYNLTSGSSTHVSRS